LFAACQGFLTPGETPDTVSQIARRFALGESAMKMRLHRWRTRYRELIRQEVAETVPHTLDLDEEMKHLLAALAS
jgi:RNA polymerase sigma-70 factor (ECF subfamily)